MNYLNSLICSLTSSVFVQFPINVYAFVCGIEFTLSASSGDFIKIADFKMVLNSKMLKLTTAIDAK